MANQWWRIATAFKWLLFVSALPFFGPPDFSILSTLGLYLVLFGHFALEFARGIFWKDLERIAQASGPRYLVVSYWILLALTFLSIVVTAYQSKYTPQPSQLVFALVSLISLAAWWTIHMLLSDLVLWRYSGKRVGSLVGIKKGPRRNAQLKISPEALQSSISCPLGSIAPESITSYKVVEEPFLGETIFSLVFLPVDATGQAVEFYRTFSKFDMMLLLDELDGTIGVRPRSSVTLPDHFKEP